MKNTVVVLTLLLALGTAAAEQGISGWVYDAQTREPIAGAIVCCYFGNARTDSTGFYAIYQLDPGRYRVRAMATGYETGYYPESVLVVHGQMTENINFHLVPLAPQNGGISGRVVNQANGQVIVHAEVRASGPAGSRTVLQGPQGYEIGELVPGKYWVSATAEGFEPGHYPDSVVVQGGQVTTNICFHLVPLAPQNGGISGRVTDSSTGKPIRGAEVVASGPNGRGAVAQGCCGYRIEDLPPGRYRVSATAEGYEPGHYPDSVVVEGGQVTSNINFSLVPVGQQNGGISGRVTDASTGELIRGAEVVASGPNGRGAVAQGCCGYQIEGLPPGKYWVSATAEGYEPGHYRDSVEVVGGQVTEGICFTLRSQGGGTGCLAGHVFDADTREPIFGALVEVGGPMRARANTCRGGRFRIRNLIPGYYVAVVSARGYETARLDSILVEAGETTELTVGLTRSGGGSGGIAGMVTDSASGDPIEGAYVQAFGPHGQGAAYTGARGNYLIEGLPPGPYFVRAHARHYYPARYPDTVFVVRNSTTEGIDFALRAMPRGNCGLAGFVYDGETQNCVPHARVTITSQDLEREVTTDAYGDFVFDELEPGFFELAADAEGFGPGIYPDQVEVVADEMAAPFCPFLYPLTGMQDERSAAAPEPFGIRVEPNPCAGPATVYWQVRQAGMVSVRVVDNSGRTVRVLHHGVATPGLRSAGWDGRDESGSRLARGVYFCRVTGADGEGMTKLVIGR